MMLAKILGKLFSYLGLLMGCAGAIWDNFYLFFVGVIVMIIGCLMHEINEK